MICVAELAHYKFTTISTYLKTVLFLLCAVKIDITKLSKARPEAMPNLNLYTTRLSKATTCEANYAMKKKFVQYKSKGNG